MKGGGSRGVRRSRRGGGLGIISHAYETLGGGKRTFIKRTCRSKSRCGGAANHGQVSISLLLLGGSRGVGRSRRGGYEFHPPGLEFQ